MTQLGIVGLGRWGRVLVDSLQEHSNLAQFRAATTGTPENARHYAAQRGLDLELDLESLLCREDIDGVVLASPHQQHYTQILTSLRAGKHVFVEKPLTLQYNQARQAAELADEMDRVLAVGFNRRFLPAVQRIKHALRTREIGELLVIESNFSLSSGYQYAPGNWRINPAESPLGGMTGLGVHLIDLLIHFGGPVERVSARSRRRVLPIGMDDSVIVAMDFESGAMANLTTVIATAPLWSVRVIGSEGWVEMRGENRLVVAKRDTSTVTEQSYEPISTEKAELEAFATALEGHSIYPVPISEAVHGVAVFEAVLESSDNNEGKFVLIPTNGTQERTNQT